MTTETRESLISRIALLQNDLDELRTACLTLDETVRLQNELADAAAKFKSHMLECGEFKLRIRWGLRDLTKALLAENATDAAKITGKLFRLAANQKDGLRPIVVDSTWCGREDGNIVTVQSLHEDGKGVNVLKDGNWIFAMTIEGFLGAYTWLSDPPSTDHLDKTLAALANLGHDVTCGACMCRAFTGADAGYVHTCKSAEVKPECPHHRLTKDCYTCELGAISMQLDKLE